MSFLHYLAFVSTYQIPNRMHELSVVPLVVVVV